MSKTSPIGYDEFELDIDGAIQSQLTRFLEHVLPTQLAESNVMKITDGAQGVYLLYLDGNLVYVGKSSAEDGLRERLLEHIKTIRDRKGLDGDNVTFKAARIYTFNPMHVEGILRGHYKRAKVVLEWDRSGFGSNDTGKERDTQKPSNFDKRYPIDIDKQLDLSGHGLPNPCPLLTALKWLKSKLPYTFRFQDNDDDMMKTSVDPNKLFGKSVTTRQILSAVVEELPEGWQATALMGWCLLYKEIYDNYPAKIEIFRKKSGIQSTSIN